MGLNQINFNNIIQLIIISLNQINLQLQQLFLNYDDSFLFKDLFKMCLTIYILNLLLILLSKSIFIYIFTLYSNLMILRQNNQHNVFASTKPEFPNQFNSMKFIKHKFKQTGICSKKIGKYYFTFDSIIGTGLTSTVYKGINEITKQQVAIKVIDLRRNTRKNAKTLLDSQIQVLGSLKHQNIIELKEVFMSSSNCYIITQYCQSGNLAAYIKQQGRIPQAKAIKILNEICSGYTQIYKKGVIHRDIKPANIFLAKNKVKIADFGFSMKFDNKQLNNINAGSPAYMAPQALFESQYSFKSDIFSIGIVFYEMLHGYTPWRCLNQKQLIKKIKNQKIRTDQSLGLSQLSKDFIARCLKNKKEERIKENEFFNHPILIDTILKITDSKQTTGTDSILEEELDIYQLKQKIIKNKMNKDSQNKNYKSNEKNNIKFKTIQKILTENTQKKLAPSLRSMKLLINKDDKIIDYDPKQARIEKKLQNENIKLEFSHKKPKHSRTQSERESFTFLRKDASKDNILQFLEEMMNLLNKNKKTLYFRQLFDKVNYIIQKIISILFKKNFESNIEKNIIMQDPYLKTIQKQKSLQQISKIAQFYFKRLIQMIKYTLQTYANRPPTNTQKIDLQKLVNHLQKSQDILLKIRQNQQLKLEDILVQKKQFKLNL